MPNVNHDGYDDRLALVKEILQEYDLQVMEIEPIAYEEDCPFQFNNFIYKIRLSEPVTKLLFQNTPYTVKPLTDVSTLVLRLSNLKAMGLNPTNRVQNEVAAMTIAREGLRNFKPGLEVLIPAIYAWKAPPVPLNPDSPGFGWILMEYKGGVPLDEYFASQSEEERKTILENIADIIAAIEGSKLPSTVDQFGGLTINHEGNIVSGEMTTIQGGPWKTHEAWWQGRLQDKLKGADKSPVIEGWRSGDPSLRIRIDEFIAQGVSSALTQAGVDSGKRVLIHGDFTMNNMLIDPDTNQLTAVLDFDFSSIGPPAHLFFSSLQDLGSSSDPTGVMYQGKEELCLFKLGI
ncbi:Phosphotransferase enzyme family protein [Penicillium herquei]|nr:Phosphotransferase enzyme family protein [Penicillium herquei]